MARTIPSPSSAARLDAALQNPAPQAARPPRRSRAKLALRQRQIEWRAASGKGTIYTYSVMRRAKEPYAIAYVTLAEGPTMMTNIVDCDFDALRVGQPVNVVFKDTENGPPVVSSRSTIRYITAQRRSR